MSWFASTQVRQFVAAHPQIPVYTISVQDDRQVSREVTEWTGVRHESPQVIVFKQGSVVSTASHEGVTVDYLVAALDSAQLITRT